MDVTPKEFAERLMKDAGASEPSDDCRASDLQLQLPPWFDEKKFKTGQKFYWDNFYGQMGAHVMGLITIIAVPSTLDVLVHTRRSSSTHTAYRRYASTILHVSSWHSHDLKPGTKAWKSLLAVRTRHLQAGKNARAVKVGSVTQRDVALTQFGFIAHCLLFPDSFGLQAFDKDSWEAFNHLWRTLIYMIGLKDKYNLCIGTVEEATEVCRILMRDVFSPLLEFPPEPYEHMAYVILDGIWSMMPLVEPRPAMYMARMLAGVPGYVYHEQDLITFRNKLKNGEISKKIKPAVEGWHAPRPRPDYNPDDFSRLCDVPEYKKLYLKERVKFNTVMFLSSVYSTYIGKMILNGMLYFLIFLTEFFPILAFIRFGYDKSVVNMFHESISDRTKPLSNAEVNAILNEPPWYYKWSPFYLLHSNN